MQTENNNWQEEIPVKPGMSKASKLPLKKNSSRVIQPIETKNCYLPLETEESPTENENTRTGSPATQNLQNSNDKNESDTPLVIL